MEFKIDQQKFSKLLYLCNSIVERKNTMPILANVRLVAENGKLIIAATDLEVSLVGEADAEVDRSSGREQVVSRVQLPVLLRSSEGEGRAKPALGSL